MVFLLGRHKILNNKKKCFQILHEINGRERRVVFNYFKPRQLRQMYIISLRGMSWGQSQDIFFFPPIIADLISAQVHMQEDDTKLALFSSSPCK